MWLCEAATYELHPDPEQLVQLHFEPVAEQENTLAVLVRGVGRVCEVLWPLHYGVQGTGQQATISRTHRRQPGHLHVVLTTQNKIYINLLTVIC